MPESPVHSIIDPAAIGPVIFAAATNPERRVCATSGIDPGAGARPVFLQTGIGVPDTEWLTKHATEIAASGLVSTGAAGGLAPNLEPGTLVLPRRVRCTDGDVFPVDPNWHDRVLTVLRPHFHVLTGDLLSVMAVMRRPEQKRDAHERTKAIVTDMESGNLAEVAAQIGAPFLVLRAVMDTAEDEIPETALTAVTASGETDYRSLIAGLARRPMDLASLIVTVRRFRSAARTLRRALYIAGQSLLSPPD